MYQTQDNKMIFRVICPKLIYGVVFISIFNATVLGDVNMINSAKSRGQSYALDEYNFRNFMVMQDSKFKNYINGFPSGIWGSSIMPVAQWLAFWTDNQDLPWMTMNFGSTLLMHLDWLKIVTLCDEIEFPRCSWAHFINYLQPVSADYDLLTKVYMANVKNINNFIPIIRGSCYAFRSIDQMSAIYIYSVCSVYWNNLKFDRTICPNVCKRNPCESIAYARRGSCQQLGLHSNEFECECHEGFVWNILSLSCIPEARCARRCHAENTESCDVDVKTGVATCICRRGYMGHDCTEQLDTCLVGSDMYDNSRTLGTEDFSVMGAIIPPGIKACATVQNSENKCIPQLGTTVYTCVCAPSFEMDRSFNFDNCLSRNDPCHSIICIEGQCISSEDGSRIMCDCEDGFIGKRCDIPIGTWSQWSLWSPCEPYCGPIRLKRKERMCLGLSEKECVGAIEQVVICEANNNCENSLSLEEEEWRDFSRWALLLLFVTSGYIGILLLLLSICLLCKRQPKKKINEEVILNLPRKSFWDQLATKSVKTPQLSEENIAYTAFKPIGTNKRRPHISVGTMNNSMHGDFKE